MRRLLTSYKNQMNEFDEELVPVYDEFEADDPRMRKRVSRVQPLAVAIQFPFAS
jgi:hypothetical protein